MTTTTNLLPTAETDAAPPVRVSLKPAGADRGFLDGAWWPRSSDLARELPSLTDLLDHCWGRITRVTVNPAYWPVIPRKVQVTRHVVHVGWFKEEQDPHTLSLLSYTVGRWDLLIIPPQASTSAAARLMAAAADPYGHNTAAALIANEYPSGVGDTPGAGKSDGGGTALRPRDVLAAPFGVPAQVR
ncbi:DUF5994 family protein [Streptomyces sp. Ac-502]|uniref:DUF5994 family protein n=1 Tax=Streptomyces sp. Ac-502 TaxID=3342801 RepID=UPI00386230A6